MRTHPFIAKKQIIKLITTAFRILRLGAEMAVFVGALIISSVHFQINQRLRQGILILVGLYIAEHIWVRAPDDSIGVNLDSDGCLKTNFTDDWKRTATEPLL